MSHFHLDFADHSSLPLLHCWAVSLGAFNTAALCARNWFPPLVKSQCVFSPLTESWYLAVVTHAIIVLGQIHQENAFGRDREKLTAVVQGNSKYLVWCKQFWLATFKEN